MRRVLLPLAGVALGLSLGGVAQAQTAERVDGKTAEKRIQSVVAGLSWDRSLDDLRSEAARSGKMIFWVQVVGDLDGGL